MKRKAIVAARNKKAKKKARVDDINVEEESAVIPRVSDLGSFETIPVEMQRYIIADIFLASPLTTDNFRTIIRIKSMCVRFKQILDVACGEDFYWGELYLKIFGDLSKNKTKKCKSAKEKFLAVYSTILEIWPQDASATERDNGIQSLSEAKAFDPTSYFLEIYSEDFTPLDEGIDWGPSSYEAVTGDIEWMKELGLDVLLYNYLKHVFDEVSKYSARLERTMLIDLHREMPLLIQDFLKKFAAREPDQMPALAVALFKELRLDKK